jgi:hypothetical protein
MSLNTPSVAMVQLRSLVDMMCAPAEFGPYRPTGDLLNIPSSEIKNVHAIVKKELADISFKISYLKERLHDIRGGNILKKAPGEDESVHTHLFVPLRQLEMKKWHLNIRYGNYKAAYDRQLSKVN